MDFKQWYEELNRRIKLITDGDLNEQNTFNDYTWELPNRHPEWNYLRRKIWPEQPLTDPEGEQWSEQYRYPRPIPFAYSLQYPKEKEYFYNPGNPINV